MPGRIYTSRVTVGGVTIYNVLADPNGVLSATRGSLAIESDAGNEKVWQNTDGATTWVQLGSGGSASGSMRVIQYVVDGALGNGNQDSTTLFPANAIDFEARFDVTVGFSPGTTVTVGTTAAPAAFMDSTAVVPDLNPEVVDTYQKFQRTDVGGADVAMRTVLGGGPVAGTGVVTAIYSVPDP